MSESRTYFLTTFGCQMNEHDSERIKGVLEEDGWQPAESIERARLLLFNTCSVRESAVNRLLGRLGEARRVKNRHPECLVALGGCYAQSRRSAIFQDLPFLDVAFGPQNIGSLPALLAAASASAASQASAFDDNAALSGDLPSRRSDHRRAWVQVMTGCTNFCSYCVVPAVRGPEISRNPEAIVEEVKRLVADGVVEITLLGQNVNSYGIDLGPPGAGGSAFARLLTRLDDVEGLRRIRFTTSHPKDLGPELIAAIRDLPAVCEHLHLPVQSGADRVLARMNRGYTRDRYLGLVADIYRSVPDIALTTDIIVGFPGEKEEDFHRTMTLVEDCRFDGAFTFVYSRREGTQAASLTGRVPVATTRRRMHELVELTQKIAEQKNEAIVGDEVEILVEGPSRQGKGQWRGRTRSNKTVNFRMEAGASDPQPGELVPVLIESATSTTLKGIARGR